ncbi:hypothetical protein LPJ57_004551 [Coemansia sp. RSA 486]|nr:hypothetical protein LPJ57_004551 [Coemansia sp. RSA 486]
MNTSVRAISRKMTLHFEFTAAKAAASGLPRIGEIVIDRGDERQPGPSTVSLQTPNFLKYTRHGLQPHLVREVAAELESMPKATRIQLEDFLGDEIPDYSGIGEQGMHGFVALDRSDMLVLDTLDPTVVSRSAKSSNSFMGIDSEGGTRRLTPEAFAKLADQLKPDIVVPLADYVEEPLPSLTQGKRISKSISRSAKWLEEYLVKRQHQSAVFAPVMGSHSPELREISAKKTEALDGISGYAFNDTSLALPFEHKLRLVQQSLSELNASKPRYMAGASAPDDAVRAILAGIDLVDSSYPYAVTEQGFASTYNFGACASSDGSATHLDLWQESMFNDFGPLVDGCECFTCRNHARSYIHHLLMTKEMLSTVLLQVHNMHYYQRFFDAIRASLASDTFAQDAKRFLEHYCCEPFDRPAGADAASCTKKNVFGELETLATQECSPTTKIQRKRHAEPL